MTRTIRPARWIAAFLLVALLAGTIAALLTPGRDPGSAFDTGPAGMSDLLAAAGEGSTVVTSTPLLMRGDARIDVAHTVLMVTGATRPYTNEEAAAVGTFLASGGHVLVAEQDGQAGSLTQRYGLSFERVPILYAEGDTPVLFHLADGDHDVPIHVPTALVVAQGSAAQPFGSTPGDAFADRDNDGLVSRSDPAGPFVVAARMPIGDQGGELWVLGSLDALSNRATADPVVQAWRTALLAEVAPAGSHVLLDQSHRPQPGSTVAAAWVVRLASQTPMRWGLAVGALVAAAAIALRSRLLGAWGPHRHDPDRFRSRRDVLEADQPTGASDPEAAGPPRRAWTQRAALAAAATILLLAGGVLFRSATALSTGLLLAAPLLAAAVGGRPAVTVTRTVEADRVPEGQPLGVRLTLQARRRSDVEVRDGIPAEDEVVGTGAWQRLLLRRGQRLQIDYQARPSLRGPHRFGPLRARSSDPFRLRSWDVPLGDPADVSVLPRRETLKRVRLPVRRPDLLMGAHPVNRAGEGTEFQALREYQAGDAMRMVNWKASARSKNLMVNLRVLESQTMFTLILDARAVSDCGPARTTPLACSARAALAIAAAAAQGRDRIRFASFGSDLAELPPAPAQRFLHLLGDHLANLRASGSMGFDAVAARLVTTIRPGTPVALFSGLEGDAGFAAGARTLVGRGASVTVFAFPVSTAPPEGPEDPDASGIAARRKRNLEELRGAGATVHEVPNDMPLEALLRMQGVSR